MEKQLQFIEDIFISNLAFGAWLSILTLNPVPLFVSMAAAVWIGFIWRHTVITMEEMANEEIQ